jgi:hypothetical protein
MGNSVSDAGFEVQKYLDTVREGKTADDLLDDCAAIADVGERVAFIRTLFKDFKMNNADLDNSKNAAGLEEKYFTEAK